MQWTAYVVPPHICSSPDCRSAWGSVILPCHHSSYNTLCVIKTQVFICFQYAFHTYRCYYIHWAFKIGSSFFFSCSPSESGLVCMGPTCRQPICISKELKTEQIICIVTKEYDFKMACFKNEIQIEGLVEILVEVFESNMNMFRKYLQYWLLLLLDLHNCPLWSKYLKESRQN